MAGHGSPPAENKANHPGRKVDRSTSQTPGQFSARPALPVGQTGRKDPRSGTTSAFVNEQAAKADEYYRNRSKGSLA